MAKPGASFNWPDWALIVAVLILAAISIAGIVQSWTALSATVDEPQHIWCGIEWLQKGMCALDLQHPPLGRIVVAVGPYFRGVRSPASPSPDPSSPSSLSTDVMIATTLHSAETFRSNIAWARAGNLPFFLLACVAVFLWARRLFNLSAALWALLLFVNLPPVLAHAGLATTDIACCATVALALYAFLYCIESASPQRLTLLGAALALAFLSKFSSVAFLGASFLLTLVYFALVDRQQLAAWRRLPARIAIVCGVAFVLIWAGYGFSSPFLASLYPEDPRPEIDNVLAARPFLRNIADTAVEMRLPLTPAIKGLQELYLHNARGHESYLLGEARGRGWWYFFPFVLGVKTPIGFLILACIGIFAIARAFGSSQWRSHLTALFALAILAVCMISKINLGVRHILAIYPLLAVMAGYAASELAALAKRKSPVIWVVPILLAGWVVSDSRMARQDYLAYFNQFVGARPERILAESDLDWGQDLYALSRRLKELRADHVSIMYFGGTPLEDAGLPPFSVLSPDLPTMEGYVAVSVRYVTLEYKAWGRFAWLKDCTPLETVGKSIYLYKF